MSRLCSLPIDISPPPGKLSPPHDFPPLPSDILPFGTDWDSGSCPRSPGSMHSDESDYEVILKPELDFQPSVDSIDLLQKQGPLPEQPCFLSLQPADSVENNTEKLEPRPTSKPCKPSTFSKTPVKVYNPGFEQPLSMQLNGLTPQLVFEKVRGLDDFDHDAFYNTVIVAHCKCRAPKLHPKHRWSLAHNPNDFATTANFLILLSDESKKTMMITYLITDLLEGRELDHCNKEDCDHAISVIITRECDHKGKGCQRLENQNSGSCGYKHGKSKKATKRNANACDEPPAKRPNAGLGESYKQVRPHI
eukprot:m.29617 g.29617  ORF g.29617 m.29617 type:complete len:306 (+) comp8119_c0_seq1:53-970(+)